MTYRPGGIVSIVVYERVSSDKQDISRQAIQRERATTDYPDAELRVIQDDGVSAFKISIFERPGGAALVRLVEAGDVDAIYTDAQDRLSRGHDDEWVMFRALCDASDTWLVIDGVRIERDLGGKAMSYLKALLARQESEEKAHRVRSSKRRSAEKGRPSGGVAPLGYRYSTERLDEVPVLVQVPAEAGVVRRIFAEFASGVSQKELARRLNQDSVPTEKPGGEWRQAPYGAFS